MTDFRYPNDGPYRQEIRDGMLIDWEAPIEMEDGVVLRCDVYRPITQIDAGFLAATFLAVPDWKASRFTPTWPSPRTPERVGSTFVATGCVPRWP